MDMDDENAKDARDMLLKCARHGQLDIVEDLLEKRNNGLLTLDIDVKGAHKANRGWTALHLTSYFGHIHIVKALLKNGANINAVNDNGDTALHRAAFTSRKDIVLLLLSYDADVSIVNNEGETAKDLTTSQDIKSMIEAAQSYETKQQEHEFLTAVTNGDLDMLKLMMQAPRPPNINCVNSVGNSALHIAAMKNHTKITVFLLQEKIDTTIFNNAGQQAVDVANEASMKELLGVAPVRDIPTLPSRHVGLVYRKQGMLGYRRCYAVVDDGVLSFFRNRGDASTGTRKKGIRDLKGAAISVDERNVSQFSLKYPNGDCIRLQLEWLPDILLQRQCWVNALNEHITYSTKRNSGCQEQLSTSTIEESVHMATAHSQILEQEVVKLEGVVGSLGQETGQLDSDNTQSYTPGDILSLRCHLQHLLISAKDTCQAFSQTLCVFKTQNQVMNHQVSVEREKSRVLQESLQALTSDNHHIRGRTPSTEDDEFFECDDEEWFNTDSDATINSSVDHNHLTNCVKDRPNVDLGRSKLPVPMFNKSDFSAWTILKQCIGKELSKITMPLIFNEPLSLLQRISEYMEYSYLLDKAVECDNIVERMQYVAAFAVSAISSNWERLGKPFNPLLGETYELNRPDLGYRLVCEQVSHHPPISAFHVESAKYRFSGSINPKLKFWGKSVEVNPKGTMKLEILTHKEVYTWQNVNCCVHNVVVGKLWVEHYGVMDIVNHKTKHRCAINFKQGGWFGKELHKLDGYIYSPDKKKLKAIYGSWIGGVYAVDVDKYESLTKSTTKLEISRSFTKNKSNGSATPRCHSAESLENSDMSDDIPCTEFPYNLSISGQQLLWRVAPRPAHSHQYYNFTHFAMMLNESPPGLNLTLPPTDVRLRPDIQLMEVGNIDGGAAEKNRLEEKQRAVRKDRKHSKCNFTPLWFSLQTNPYTQKEDWVFNYKYYNRDWTLCEDIF